MKNVFKLTLSKDEALVFFEWLARFNESENAELFEHPSEQQILFDLECQLETMLEDPFIGRYQELLRIARKRLQSSRQTD